MEQLQLLLFICNGERGLKNVAAGANPISIKLGMEKQHNI
jgi:hypothetical protein